MTEFSEANLGRAFKIIEDAAIKGERCPVTGPYGKPDGIQPGILMELADRGNIRVEYSQPNWRQVFIMIGPNSGKATAPNPKGNKPYRIRGPNGMTECKRSVPIAGAKPTLPKLRFMEQEID